MNTNRWTRLLGWKSKIKKADEEENTAKESNKTKKEETPKIK